MINQGRYIITAILILLIITVSFVVLRKLFVEKQERIVFIPSEPIQSSSLSEPGKQIFEDNCVACHAIFKDMTGPALSGLENRWPNKFELIQYIKNASVKSKDRILYVEGLRVKYGTKHMAFKELTNDQIQTVLDYINNNQARPIPDVGTD